MRFASARAVQDIAATEDKATRPEQVTRRLGEREAILPKA